MRSTYNDNINDKNSSNLQYGSKVIEVVKNIIRF